MISISEDTSENAVELRKSFDAHLTHQNILITNIKQSLFKIVQVNIGVSTSPRGQVSIGAILNIGRKNIDDLKRIESILKGLVKSKQQQSEKKMCKEYSSSEEQPEEREGLNIYKQEFMPHLQVERRKNLKKRRGRQISIRIPEEEKCIPLQESGINIKKSIDFQKILAQQNQANRLIIKELQIQIIFLRKQNQELRQKNTQLNSELEYKAQKEMLFSFGKPYDNKINTYTVSGRSPDLMGIKESMKSSSAKIRQANSRNKQCLQLLRTMKGQLEKREREQLVRKSLKKSERNGAKQKKIKVQKNKKV